MWSTKLVEFLEATSAHGFHQIATTSSNTRRAVYVTVVMASFAFLVFCFSQSVIEFRKFDSYYNTQVESRDDVIMPSITICSYALHTRSAFQRRFPNISADLFADQLTYSTMFKEYGSWFNRSGELRDYDATPIQEVYTDLRPQTEDVFVHCSLYLLRVNCSDFVTPFHTDLGLCHVVHSYNYTQEHGPIRVAMSMQKAGFTFILDAHPDDYLYTNQLGSGFLVHVHDSAQYPQTDGESIHVGVGQSVNLAFTKEIHEVLPQPYSKQDCVDSLQDIDYDASLVNDYPYTKKACEFQCMEVMFFKHEGCYYSAGPPSERCSNANIHNIYNNPSYQNDLLECRKNCKRLCSFNRYITKVTTATYPNPLTVRFANRSGFPVQTEEEIRRRMLELNVYPQTLEHTYVTQQPRYHAFDIFSNIGGLMGLCLGISLVTVIEFVEFGGVCIVRAINKRKQDKIETMRISNSTK